MKLLNIMKNIYKNALDGDKWKAIKRFIYWQMQYHFFGKTEMIIHWIDDLKLLVLPHRAITTGNYYLGLMEFEEMSFILHYLQEGDIMYDIGANIGDYSLLGGHKGAMAIAVEPSADTCKIMEKEISLNQLNGKVIIEQCAIGTKSGQVAFSEGLDAENKILDDKNGENTVHVQMKSVCELSDIYGVPSLIKIDVEGYEIDVIRSAGSILENKALNVIIAEINDNQIIEQLEALGYKRYQYIPQKRDLESCKRDKTMNGIFVRDLALVIDRVKNSKPYCMNGQYI